MGYMIRDEGMREVWGMRFFVGYEILEWHVLQLMLAMGVLRLELFFGF